MRFCTMARNMHNLVLGVLKERRTEMNTSLASLFTGGMLAIALAAFGPQTAAAAQESTVGRRLVYSGTNGHQANPIHPKYPQHPSIFGTDDCQSANPIHPKYPQHPAICGPNNSQVDEPVLPKVPPYPSFSGTDDCQGADPIRAKYPKHPSISGTDD